jgi:hypothetical protein
MPPVARYVPSPAARRGVKAFLWLMFAIAGAILSAQLASGLWSSMQPRRGLLNASGFCFVSLVLLTILAARSGSLAAGATPSADATSGRFPALALATIWAVAIVAYLPGLADPFLFDDYTHLSNAARQSWSEMIANSLLVHPRSGDFFFRPVGYISYWLDYRWAGDQALRWHLWNVLAHATNSVLVYVLGRQLQLSRRAAVFAGLLFAVHASHAEVTGWMAARFDLLAFLFSAVALIATNLFADSRKRFWVAVMLGATLLAVLSKEAAFGLPLMALCMIPFRRAAAASIAKLSGAMAAVSAGVFLYRTWFLGGVGGYQTESGTPAILNFHLLAIPNALLFRLWGLLLFPLNWSAPPAKGLIAAALSMLVAVALLVWIARAHRARLLGSLGLILAAALPVQHLLLIGPDFAGGRVLYLPTLGLALFWGVLFEGCDRPRLALVLGAALLVFQWVALQHNLWLRTEAAHLSQQTCAAMGDELRRDSRPILVEGLPRTWKGVYFLANGFIPCVAIQSRMPEAAARVFVGAGSDQPSLRIFTWNGSAGMLVETGRHRQPTNP